MDISSIEQKGKSLQNKAIKIPANNIYKKLSALSREVARQKNQISYLEKQENNFSKRQKAIENVDLQELKLKLKELRLEVRHKVTDTQVQRVALSKESGNSKTLYFEESISMAGTKLLNLIAHQKYLQKNIAQKAQKLHKLTDQLNQAKKKLPPVRPKPIQIYSDPEDYSSIDLTSQVKQATLLREEIEHLKKQEELIELKLSNQAHRMESSRVKCNDLMYIKKKLAGMLEQEQANRTQDISVIRSKTYLIPK